MDDNLKNLARKQLTTGQAHILGLGYLLWTWFEQNLVVNYKLLIMFIKSLHRNSLENLIKFSLEISRNNEKTLTKRDVIKKKKKETEIRERETMAWMLIDKNPRCLFWMLIDKKY